MGFRGARRLAVSAAVVSVLAVAIAPASAYQAEIPEWVTCVAEGESNQAVLEYSLKKSVPATAKVGTPVTFAGQSASAVTFAVASSPAALGSPDIDSGAGIPGALEPGIRPNTATYAFTSTKATATPRTVYWQASFSDAGLHDCPSVTGKIFTTAVRTLTVEAPPAEFVSAPPIQEPAQPPLHVRVTLAAHSFVHGHHPAIGYTVTCSTVCSGSTYYRVLGPSSTPRHDRRGPIAAELGSGRESLAIAAPGGGSARFTLALSARTLRLVRALLHRHAPVTIQVWASAHQEGETPVLARAAFRLTG